MADQKLPLFLFTTQEDWYGELTIILADQQGTVDLTARQFEMDITQATTGGNVTPASFVLTLGSGLEFKGTDTIVFRLSKAEALTLARSEFTADILEIVGGERHLFMPVRISYSEPSAIRQFLSRALGVTYAGNRQPIVAALGIPGAQGRPGRTIVSSVNPPTGSQGTDGDYWIQDRSGADLPRRMYGPKIAASWGTPWLIETITDYRDVPGLVDVLALKAEIAALNALRDSLDHVDNTSDAEKAARGNIIGDAIYAAAQTGTGGGEPGDGTPGAPGRGIADAVLRLVGEYQHLVLIYTDGTEDDVGRVEGARGTASQKGDKGDPGIQGIPGEKGDRGLAGGNGADGLPGGKGDPGVKGDTGGKGDPGIQGPPGLNGRGISAATIVNGRLYITYSDGTDPVDVGPVGTGSGGGSGATALPAFYSFSAGDGTLTNGQTTFTVPGGYVGAVVEVFVNGKRAFKSEYSASNGSTVVISNPALTTNDTVTLVVSGPVGASGGGSASTALAVTFNPAGGIAATNVQAALEEVDSETLKKASNLSDVPSPALARNALGLGSVATLSGGTGAGNVPVLDGAGLLLASILPALAITDTFVVASQTEMLALTAQRGDVAIRTDSGIPYILRTEPATTLGNWIALSSAAQGILSIAGLTSSSISAAQLIAALSLTIGTNVQAWDSDLQAIVDQGTVAYGRALLAIADQPGLAALLKAAAVDLWTLTNDSRFLTSKTMADAMSFKVQAWAATLSLDWTAGFNKTVTSAGLTTFSGPFVGGVDGEPVSIEYVQPASGGGGLAFNGTYFKLPTGLTITASTAANAVDIIDGQLHLIGGIMICQIRSFTKGAR